MHKIKAPEHLQEYITQYTISEWNTKDNAIYFPAWVKSFIFFQTGEVSALELINKKRIEFPSSMVNACMSRPSRFMERKNSIKLISVELKPMLLYNCLQKDISFLKDTAVKSEIIFPGSAVINTELLKEKNDLIKIEILNSYFTKLFKNCKNPGNAIVQSILDEFEQSTNEKLSYKEVLTKLDISVRHSRRIFKRIMGITPHLYYRISRLENIIIKLKNNPEQKFIDLMHAYADQSHFIKDFVRFTNRKPEDFKNMLQDIEKRKPYEYL